MGVSVKIKSFLDDKESAQIDLTPLIDVVFILLIFFILSASFSQDEEIPVDRPSAESGRSATEDSFNITLDDKGQLWLKRRQISFAELSAEAKQHKGSDAVIQADTKVPTGDLIETIDLLRLAGVQNVSVATKRQ